MILRSKQATDFIEPVRMLQKLLGYTFIKTYCKFCCYFRHPEYQFDMVRLGIGLYGVDSIGESKLNLLPVATLQINHCTNEESKKRRNRGYSRKGIVNRDSMIATIRIGYADGFSRKLGNGSRASICKRTSLHLLLAMFVWI